MNAYTTAMLNELKTIQTQDVEQLAKYKSLSMGLDEKIRERAQLIKLIEAGSNPERRNDTIAQTLNI